MSEATAPGPSLIKLGKLANAKKFDDLESIWIKALDNPDYTARELVPIAGQVGRLGAADRAETLLEMLISHSEEKHGAPRALEIARMAAGHLPNGPGLRNEVIRLYEAVNSDVPRFELLLHRLCREDIPLDRSVALIDVYLQLPAGAYLVDHSYLVPGVVESVNSENGVVSVRFDQRHADYGPDTIGKIVPKPDDHFPALVLYDPERLRTLADEDAVAFVELALKASKDGRVQYRDLKNQVTRLLDEKGWRLWWRRARPELKRAPLIGMASGSQPSFRILKKADRYEDRLRREFDHAKEPAQRLLKVLAYLDEVAKAARSTDESYVADDKLLVHFGNGAAKIAVAALRDDPALALSGLAVHAAVADRGVAVATPNPRAAVQVLGKIEDLGQLPQLLPEALLHHTLIYLRLNLPDGWPAVWSKVLMRCGKRMIDVITKALIESDQIEELEQALVRAVERPTSSPELVSWLWRARHTATSGKVLTGFASLPALTIVHSLLALVRTTGRLRSVSGEERHQRILEMARNTLFFHNSEPVREVLSSVDREQARSAKTEIQHNDGLNAAQRAQLLGVLRNNFPELFVEIDKPWEEDALYTTEAGLRKRQKMLQQIIEHDIPEVAQQIGEAASHGDLSENAEYTAALEKRDQLTSRAARIESELKRAVQISWDMARSNYVNIGTRILVRHERTEEESTFTFLGLWDTDTEQGILDYQAPLALAFMGLRVGDTAVYEQDGQQLSWQILAIEPAL